MVLRVKIVTCRYLIIPYVYFIRSNCVLDLPSTSVLTIVPNNTTVLRGNTLSLICSTEANPDAHVYQFYVNGNLICNSSSGVFNITVEADGVYTCVPINTVGTGHNATVNVTAVGESVDKDNQASLNPHNSFRIVLSLYTMHGYLHLKVLLFLKILSLLIILKLFFLIFFFLQMVRR